ncbi:hypothetical protein An01g09230 [Aspergillus niger]|uniref:Uncharacterized protein n=2 Tax=Aspergillus niger TaxID=5061 RepID=A2Q9V4_ASPNC|nr:hypothetical protein An01g09230 [Aspergillus niger]CAK43973.1 hypothetical protein An01g09230 [Aspergillus niger]
MARPGEPKDDRGGNWGDIASGHPDPQDQSLRKPFTRATGLFYPSFARNPILRSVAMKDPTTRISNAKAGYPFASLSMPQSTRRFSCATFSLPGDPASPAGKASNRSLSLQNLTNEMVQVLGANLERSGRTSERLNNDHTWTTGGIVQGSIDERVKPVRAAIPHSGHWGLLGGIEGSDPAESGTGLVSDSRTREPPSLSGYDILTINIHYPRSAFDGSKPFNPTSANMMHTTHAGPSPLVNSSGVWNR